MNLSFLPRAAQGRVLAYAGGKLGVAAVPGSGKTHTLSALAATWISQGHLEAGQEILIVTLVNSAVDNFTARLDRFSKDLGLRTGLGYRVRTLHGLAHDIVRENPRPAKLDAQFSILDEVAASAVRHESALAWVRANPLAGETYIKSGLEGDALHRILATEWPAEVERLASSLIRAAKDKRLSPSELGAAIEQGPRELELARMGAGVYTSYQDALVRRGAVDFDDLVRLAADILDRSPELVERLRHRWPIILEDEAQDSSQLQERILSTLAGPQGNWVRVGDPNQAIFETFTTADPELLRRFIRLNTREEMPVSGRCQPSVIALANHLISWTADHPVADVRSALSEPMILPTSPDDPQPNPPDDPDGIQFIHMQHTPQQEIETTAASLKEWLPQHQDWTVAVLSATNDHAAKAVRALQARGIGSIELLKSTAPTRAVAGALSNVLSALVDPGSSSKLAKAYRVWRRDWRAQPGREHTLASTARYLTRTRYVEELFSEDASDRASFEKALNHQRLVSTSMATSEEQRAIVDELWLFRNTADRWHRATVLPIDQLVLTLAQDIFTDSSDLALSHKLALVLSQLSRENRQWRLPELAPQLRSIALNERRFIGFSNDDTGFQPEAHRGKVVVTTMHRAKGLEWDRVHLLSVNDYDFPSSQLGDSFISERWFVRDGLNLEAEALAQLNVATSSPPVRYEEGLATRQARADYARERLRLLYVGITRARRELILSWNTGRRGTAGPALAFVELQEWWLRNRTPASN